MTNSTKPAKPYKDYPLYPHASGQWAKTIKGRKFYFGPWDDPQAALDEYNRVRDDLYAGRKPRPKVDGITVADLCNRFLTSKQHALDAGELSSRSFLDYHRSCEKLVDAFGGERVVIDLQPDDFQLLRTSLAKRLGPVALGNEINRVRSVFNFAWKNCLIDAPVRFGMGFDRPTKKTLRKHRAANPERFFQADEIRLILKHAKPQMRAMVLIAVNCGFGNNDVATLPIDAVDLANGWIDYERPKTGVQRRCPLWAETIDAIGKWLEMRPQPRNMDDHGGLLFITEKFRSSWSKDIADNPIAKEFRKLTKCIDAAEKLDAPITRKGVSFYSLRHVFETVSGEAKDQPATDAIMGHCRDDMASVYRHGISDDRLRAVTDCVRTWLFGDADETAGRGNLRIVG